MFLRYNLTAIIWAIIMAILILLPGKDMPTSGDLLAFDKLAHATVFAILIVLTIVGFQKQNTYRFLENQSVFSAVMVGLSYNILLEFSQLIIPDRQFDKYDLFANCLGIVIGIIVFLFIYKI